MSGSTLGASCALFVPSCDPYSDLWTPFFTLLFRYWPDCPCPVVLGANDKVFDHPRVQTMRSSHGTNWANRVMEQLERLPQPYVLMWLEDFFLQAPVDSAGVDDAFSALRANDAVTVRLTPRPRPDHALPGYPNLGIIEPDAPYRVSTQASIWNRQALLDLMRSGESIWQFELLGSVRSRESRRPFLGSYRPLLPYDHHVVERGKWFRSCAAKFAAMNIGVDLSARPVMTRRESLAWNLQKSVAATSDLIPWRHRMQLRRRAKRMLGRSLESPW